ncbi:hypothetical protein [Paenibacillus methanolicus]|uniref:Uncharacterized protein n=1 Tax=Paenibacillus methanolicus TaxID=582686 RepID=A0A5S5C0U2_9BACL|nr:hypothetical protein [Paenibacillus methanolicus]TYP73055.1 hypothetical protein BCM02_10739 [Paenibacillus methanolicus]
MSVIKMINSHVSGAFASLGFHHEKIPGKPTCMFLRELNGFKPQYIEFEQSDWTKNAIRVNYYTAGKSTCGRSLIGETVDQWYIFENEQDVKRILDHVIEVTETHAIAWFENNVEAADRIKEIKNLDQLLSPKVQVKTMNYIQQNNIDLNRSDTIQILEELLIKQSDNDTLLYSTFILGEIVKNLLGGAWEVTKDGVPIVRDIGGTSIAQLLRPERSILSFVNNPRKGWLTSRFELYLNLMNH